MFGVTGPTAASIDPGTDIPLTANGPLLNILHATGAAPVQILTAGTYYIAYSVNYFAGEGASIALAVDSVVNNTTIIPLLAEEGNVAGTAMLALSAGDTVTLRNSSSTKGFDTATSPPLYAQMTLIRLT